MKDPDFFDFMLEGGYDLLFPDDEDENYECPHCGRIIEGNEKVEWIDKKNKIFKCPECGEEVKI
jgi:DNA-directed RNA polymerase subunit RPC12/RpoP